MTYLDRMEQARWEREGQPFAPCQRCHGPIKVGEPYMPRLPFLNWTGAGLDHQYCPPRLVS